MKFGLIGNPLKHSHSPELHAAFGIEGYRLCEVLPEEKSEQLRVRIPCQDGDHTLTDYASCGKNWNGEHCNISAWLNVK